MSAPAGVQRPLRSAEGAAPRDCYHCGGPIPAGPQLTVRIEGRDRVMCCHGCQAVAQIIVDSGLERYYRVREAEAPKPEDPRPEEAARLAAFDDPGFQQRFVERGAGEGRTASLILEGIHCPACCWLIEQRLAALPGMKQAVVNYASQRATVSWDNAQLRLSAILQAVARLGYGAHPFDPHTRSVLLEQERRAYLRRIGLAGLLGMQVMMLSVALYFRDWPGIEQVYRDFFRWLALLLTIPVVVYSGWPFFRNAWRDIRALRAGMDVPVSLGIALAFLGSLDATVTGRAPVYFDSVVMFVFILLLGRYMEFRVRSQALLQLDRLARMVPATAVRLEAGEPGAREKTVPVAALRPGDTVLVRPGETVPTDGVVVEGDSSVDEAILTGEGRPRRRRPGDPVIGGSTNCESPIHIRVERVGAETVLSRIARLVEQGQSQKPALTLLADRVAAWFVYVVLLTAAAVAGYGWNARPADWLPITVSVLVVSCPCALALAVPTALAGAISRCMRRGIIIARANAVESLNRATTFVFDKTGTLTRGQLTLIGIQPLADRTREDCLAVAAALEQGSEHPIARAMRVAARNVPGAATDVRNHPGEGITGKVGDAHYVLGSAAFLRRLIGRNPPEPGGPVEHSGIRVRFWLAGPIGPIAVFDLGDELRPDARGLIDYLIRRGRTVAILSGDAQGAVSDLAAVLGIELAVGDCLPERKVALLRAIAAEGEVTCMVGDGINDAPVLSAAHVSVAMAGSTDMAQSSADLILPEGKLAALQIAVHVSARAMRVIRQNAAWAIAYNLFALPLAASGWITPWMAALGMSLSSLLVVANSARLGAGDPD